MRQDLLMRKEFFKHFNDVQVFNDRFWMSNEDIQLFTDSADAEGLSFGENG